MRIRIIARFKNDNLRQARLNAGLTIEEISKMLGMNKVEYYAWEGFRRYPFSPDKETDNLRQIKSQERAKKLEKILKMPYEDLFPIEYRQAVNLKLGKPIEKIFEHLELPESYIEKNLLLPSPEDIYEKIELKEITKKALEFLTEREAKVLKMRFGLEDENEHTLEEIGRQFKLSKERIREIEAKALRKLKHPIRWRKLKNFSYNDL